MKGLNSQQKREHPTLGHRLIWIHAHHRKKGVDYIRQRSGKSCY